MTKQEYIKAAHERLPSMVTDELCERLQGVYMAIGWMWTSRQGLRYHPMKKDIRGVLDRLVTEHLARGSYGSISTGGLMVYTDWDDDEQEGQCGIQFCYEVEVGV